MRWDKREEWKDYMHHMYAFHLINFVTTQIADFLLVLNWTVPEDMNKNFFLISS